MNPVAVFFIVFFLAFQSGYLYVFTQSIPGVPLLFIVVISAIFGGISAFAEYEWENSTQDSSETSLK